MPWKYHVTDKQVKTVLPLWFYFVQKLTGQVVDSQWLYLVVGHLC